MTSQTTAAFWKLYEALPPEIQRQAQAAYSKFEADPYNAGLRFKQVHEIKPIFSVRISRDYRAVGIKNRDDIIWFWIGSHSDYDKLLSRF